MKKFYLTRDEKKAIPFILPGVAVTALLIIYPLFYIISMSFSENAIGQSGFAGLTNYLRLFKNPMFTSSIWNTLVWTLGTVIPAFLIGFILALLINRRGMRIKGVFRSLIFVAWIIPGVVKATAWKWLFTTDGGMINHLLMSIGVIEKEIAWLSSPQYAMLSVIIVQVWAINEFSLIFIMTSGGQNTTTLSILVYNQFQVLNINSASASAVMQLLITMIFAALYVKFVIKEEN